MITIIIRVAGLLVAFWAAAGADPVWAASGQPSDVGVLQHRLGDAGCYTGPLDGVPSEALNRASAACPSQAPQLRIETGTHIAPINQISADAACSVLATGSEDKTVRLWSTAGGQLLKTFRVPIGAGNEGKIKAVALSPDGRLLAAAGWDARTDIDHINSIYVFDAASGAVVNRLSGMQDVILRLAFSPDGRWLAAVGATIDGLRVYDTTNWSLVASDARYGNSTYGLAFGPDGRLYTVSLDGGLRRYGAGPAFAKQATSRLQGGQAPRSVSVDPRGELVAVTFLDASAVSILDANTLRPRATARPARGRGLGNLFVATWSRNGDSLLAGGNYQGPGDPKRPILLPRFGRNGQMAATLQPFGDDSVTDLTSCGGGFVAADGPRGFGLVSDQGVGFRPTATADMRDKVGNSFMVSSDARQVRFGLDYGEGNPIVFDLDQATVSDSPQITGTLRAPIIDSLPVSGWQNGFTPSLAGRRLPLRNNELVRALAARPDRSGFVLGGTFRIHAYSDSGEERWNVEAPAEASGVNLSADGRLVIATFGDGTVRWYRWADGQELLALFINHDTRAWVAWTPTGYYKASPGGEDMIGWHVNRGWDQPPDFFPASKFRDQFARPDIIDRVLIVADEGEAKRLADAERHTVAPPKPVLDVLPPVLAIVSPSEGSHASEASLQIDYILRSPSSLAVDGVTTLIDGKPAGSRGLAPMSAVKPCLADSGGLGIGDGALKGCRGTVTVQLPPGTSEIALVARAGTKTSEAARIHVTRDAPAEPSEIEKPNLYALVVGVSDYIRPDYKLAFAAKDASDFAQALSNQEGGLYGHVVVDLLTDRMATDDAIKDGLDRLSKQVTEHDVGIIYMAGHGLLDDNRRFYFLGADSDQDRLRATAVGREEITQTLDTLKGQAVLFLDACHAGAVATGGRPQFDVNPVIDDFRQTDRGIVIYAGSTGRQSSLENEIWGHGAFTKAIIDGLGVVGHKGQADLFGDGTITTGALNAFLARRVKELTEGLQNPVMTSTSPDFPIALIRSP